MSQTQSQLKRITPFIPLGVYQSDVAGRYFRKIIATNDGNRAGQDMEVIHTMVNGITPVRHQAMTRVKARKMNYFNRKNGIPFKWVMGKQDIPDIAQMRS